MITDVIEVRLPPKPQYLSVLRANVGVIAGGISFDYDQIIQLRTAVAEAFEMAIDCISHGGTASPREEMVVRFTVAGDRLEVRIGASGPYQPPPEGEEGQELQALLESLVDELELGSGAVGTPIIRMTKYR